MSPGDFRVPPSPCPHCGKVFDGAGMIPGNTPEPPKQGDFTVCFECVAPLRFGPELRLEAVTPEEIPEEEKLALFQVQMAIVEVRTRQ